jgi:hypothetical protein
MWTASPVRTRFVFVCSHASCAAQQLAQSIMPAMSNADFIMVEFLTLAD